MQRHKNKTLATAFATFFGGLGLHRFYLSGVKDLWGWAHLLAAALALPAVLGDASMFGSFALAPLVLSMLVGFIEALVIGLTPDEKWDQRHNPDSGKESKSRWPLAVLLVLTLGIGFMVLIAALARSLDLLLTGGAYG